MYAIRSYYGVEATAPATVFINPASTLNRGGRTPGVVIRAAVEAPGYSMSKVATQSYIFIDAVSEQDAPGGMWRAPRATFDWPGYTAPQSIAYLMNQEITQSSTYADLMDDALFRITSYNVCYTKLLRVGTDYVSSSRPNPCTACFAHCYVITSYSIHYTKLYDYHPPQKHSYGCAASYPKYNQGSIGTWTRLYCPN